MSRLKNKPAICGPIKTFGDFSRYNTELHECWDTPNNEGIYFNA